MLQRIFMEIYRGSRLQVDAPDNAVRWRIAGAGKVMQATVVDGKATFDGVKTETFPDADYVSEFELSVDGDVDLVAGPSFTILPSIKQGGVKSAPRSFAQQALALVEQALLAASSSGEISVGADEVSFSYETRGELLAYRTRLLEMVAQERNGSPTGSRFVSRRRR